jgi:hypothetical protein
MLALRRHLLYFSCGAGAGALAVFAGPQRRLALAHAGKVAALGGSRLAGLAWRLAGPLLLWADREVLFPQLRRIWPQLERLAGDAIGKVVLKAAGRYQSH